jgi:hypothetical protein
MTPFIPWENFPSAPAAAILPWAPDWADGVQEALSWKMGSVMSKSGVEDRRSVRRDPRQRIEFSTLVEPDDVPLLQSLLLGWGAQTWAVPLWYGQCRLSAVALAGDNVLAVGGGTASLFQVGNWALVWSDSRTMGYAQVLSFDDTSVTLATDLVGNFPIGAKVVPLQFMTLQASQSFSPLTSGVTKISWIFEQVPGYTPALAVALASLWTETFPTGASPAEPRNHFFAFPHNWAGSPEITVTTLADAHDPDVGVLSRRLAVDRTSPMWAVDTLLDTRAATAALRNFLSAHRGPTVSFWAPSPMRDLGLAGDITGGVLPVINNAQHLVPPQLRTGVELTYPGGQVRELVAAVAPTTVTLSADPLNQTPQISEYFSAGLAGYTPGGVPTGVFSVTAGELTIDSATTISDIARVFSPIAMVGFTCEFRINSAELDDGGAIAVADSSGTAGFAINPIRETAIDSTRTPWVYFGLTTTGGHTTRIGNSVLPLGVWHTVRLYDDSGNMRVSITNQETLEVRDDIVGAVGLAAVDRVRFVTDGTPFSPTSSVSYRNVSALGTAAVLPDVPAGNVNRSRWVSRARLAVETVTIQHLTDQVATVRLPVVAVYNGDTPPSVTGPA